MTKKYLKNKPVCKVTFNLNKEIAKSAKKVHLVGDFNNWSKTKTSMSKLKNGNFTKTLDLAVGKEYQYRYLIDGANWTNDNNADSYVSTSFGSENCVVKV